MTVLLGADREPGSSLPLVEQFRFDAGSPALNLLATRGYRGTAEPVERLISPGRLEEWLAANGLPVVDVDERDVTETRAVREAAYAVLTYAVLTSAVATATPEPADVATLNRWATRPVRGPALTLRADGVAWEPAHPTFRVVLAGMARDLATAAVEGPALLRLCAADTCRMLYLDRSRGRRRRWCSMGRCGNVAKVARHRGQAGDAQ